MGGESSKYKVLKENPKSKPTKLKSHTVQKQKNARLTRELEVLRQLEMSGCDSSISSGGVSFYMPFGEGDHVTLPHAGRKDISKQREFDSIAAPVRVPVTGAMPMGYQKPAEYWPNRMAMERHLRAEERGARREQEMRVRYVEQLEEMERRRRAVEEKQRPPYTRLRAHTKHRRL